MGVIVGAALRGRPIPRKKTCYDDVAATECRPYNDALHDLHSFRRRALRVPHAEQRIYIVRANQLVTNALMPRIKIRTAAFSKKSFKC